MWMLSVLMMHSACMAVRDDSGFATEGRFSWLVPTSMIHEMQSAPSGSMFVADEFKLALRAWQIEVYPNGQDYLAGKDRFGMALTLRANASEQPHDDIIAFTRIACIQTSASYSTISRFNSPRYCAPMTRFYPFSVQQLKEWKHTEMRFEIEIVILRMNLAEIPKPIEQYARKMQFAKSSKFVKHSFSSHIGMEMLRDMVSVEDIKSYSFGVTSSAKQMWNLQFLVSARGNLFDAHLQIAATPKGISMVKVKYVLSCDALMTKTTRKGIPL